MKKKITLLLCLALVFSMIPNTGKQTKAATATLLNTYGSLFGHIGSAVTPSEMQNSDTLNAIKGQYNSVTMENEMKPDAILGSYANLISVADAKALGYYIPEGYTESTVPRLNFTTMDKMLQICYQNGLKMRGHTLVWHGQTPNWLFRTGYSSSGSYVSQAVMNKRMEFYIKSVMGHAYSGQYASVIYAWDVVNEYLHASSSGSGWQQIYGSNLGTTPSFVKSAFQYAYEALQKYGLTNKVSLFYNDYNEYMEADNIVSMIKWINSSQKLCSGIGMQSHLSTTFPSISYYKSALQKFANAGFEIQITELDAGCTDFNTQAQYYYDLMSAILSVKKAGGNITGITYWGLSDANSWRSSDKPLLFSTINQPKQAYTSVLKAYTDAGYSIGNPGGATPTPTVAPTVKPTVAPTVAPTVKPTTLPTIAPTSTPSQTTGAKPVVAVQTTNNGNSINQTYTVSAQGGTIDLSKVKIVFTADGMSTAEQNVWIDNAALQLTVAPYYTALNDSVSGSISNGSLTVSISNNTSLTAGTGSLIVNLRFAKTDWSTYGTLSNPTIKVYYDGTLIQ